MKKGTTTKTIPVGTRFGLLEIIGVGEPKAWGRKRVSTSICKCECGETITYPNNTLLKGKARTCGAKIHKQNHHHIPRYISKGYVFQYSPNHPKANKAGYVREHVLIMEKHLGRYLNPDEVVHHKDFNRSNNNFENL